MLVYTARHVLTVASPPIASGAVAVHEGRIVAVGRRKDVQKVAGADAPARDLGDVALLPGLVNAHTHVELSWMGAAPPPGGDYMAWLRDLVVRRSAVNPAVARSAAKEAVRLLEERGTVAVGDVGNETWIGGLLARSSPRGIVFHEIYGFRSPDAERLLDDAAARLDAIEQEPEMKAAASRLRVVLTPHAAHTLSPALLKALAGRATAAQEPLSIHVAESEAESDLLQHGAGPMAEFLKERDLWDAAWRPPGHSPVEYLDRLGVLSPRTLAVHCIHLSHQDLSKLQARGSTVVTCPRSNARLNVGKAPVPKLLASGIPVALGTDSLASATDLDLFAEMAALSDEHPGLAPATVLRMATLNGARALGLEKDLGSIEPGKLAALVAVPLEDPDDDPLAAVTSCPETVIVLQDDDPLHSSSTSR